MTDPQVNTFDHERRFILERNDAEAFIKKTASCLTLDVYDLARPVSYTRTTYLDTDDLAFFRSCDGPVSRRLRIREYAAAPDLQSAAVITACFLEFKESEGALRTKARVAAKAEILATLVANRGTPDTAGRAMLGDSEPFIAIQRHLQNGGIGPRMTTWYRRVSLTNEATGVRVSLDEGIEFCRPGPLGENGGFVAQREVVAYGPSRVLEVKYRGMPPEWLIKAMDGLIEDREFSKFRMGMRALEEQNASASSVRGKRTKPIEIPRNIPVRKG